MGLEVMHDEVSIYILFAVVSTCQVDYVLVTLFENLPCCIFYYSREFCGIQETS